MRTACLMLLTGALALGCSKNEPIANTTAEASGAPDAAEAATKAADSPSGTPVRDSNEAAPDRFAVELDTTKGPIVIDVHRAWSPHGADRFYSLVQNGYYTDVAFFRVIDGFMAQVGISGDPALNAKWKNDRIEDDPVEQSNTRGMVSFASSGPDSRTTQFFISFVDNSQLDRMGFSPFGKVRDMATVDALYAGYGEGAPRGRGPSQALMQSQGNSYLQKDFPKLDYIKSAKVLP